MGITWRHGSQACMQHYSTVRGFPDVAWRADQGAVRQLYPWYWQRRRRFVHTVLVEIIRDSKNKYFFQRSRIIKLWWSKCQDRKLLGSWNIRHVRICACKSSRDLYRERRRRCGAGGREGKDPIVNRGSTACRTSSVTSATVRGAIRTVSVRKDIQTARR